MNGNLVENLDDEATMKFHHVMRTSHAIEVGVNDIKKAVESVHHFVSAHLRSISDEVVQQKISMTALYKSPIEKALRNMMEHCGTVVVIVRTIDSGNSFTDWISFMKYCRNQIPKATGVLAVCNDNVFPATPFHHLQLQGFDVDSTFEIINLNESIRLNHQETNMVQENASVFKQNDEDADEMSTTFGVDFFTSGLNSSSNSGISSSSTSFSITGLPPLASGWHLLKILSPLHSINQVVESNGRDQEACCTAAFALPISSRTNKLSFYLKNDDESSIERRTSRCSRELPEKLELVLKKNPSICRFFSYEELRVASSDFSTEKLIGEGGCSSVYKGTIDGEKTVAIKVVKSYKEAWDDFTLEILIVVCLKNKHITSLIGVCLEENHIISVYEFLPKGSLNDHLHGSKRKAVMPWKARLKAAIVVAEALNYLHNECETPVIHRDVKSSNILLSHAFQAQLSDFGLAIQGPKDSPFLSHVNVVGTFGYVAPEYFMHGRVSDKVDVYSFGVVLLELLSGRRPIGNANTPKGQENLIKWAKSLIDSGKLKALMDPKLNGIFDTAEMHRMVLAATLCITPSHRLRPNIGQILQLLKEEDKEEWLKSYIANIKVPTSQDDDEMYSNSSSSRCLDLAFLDLEDDDTSTSVNANQRHMKRIKDFLKEPQD